MISLNQLIHFSIERDSPPLLIIGFAILFLIFLYVIKMRPRKKLKIYRFKDFDKAARKGVKSGQIILGVERNKEGPFLKPVFLPDATAAYHGQIVGSSGSGKTQMTLCLAYQFMLRGWPVFYMENKGDIHDFEVFAALAKRAGREKDVIKMDFSDPQSPKMNVLRLPGGDRDPQKIANQIVRVTGREPSVESESAYYKQIDSSRFFDMAKVMIAAGVEPTLKEALKYFMDQEYRHHQIFSNCPDKAAIHMAKLGLDSQSGDMGAILSSLNTWTSSYLAELINAKEPDITIEDIFEKNRLAYIAIPVGDAQFQTNALGRMLIALLLSYSQLRQKRVGNRNPAGIIFEEFAEFVTPAFATLVTTARSAGLRIVLSHQDLKQLRKIEGMDIEAFIGNVIANTAGFKIFFNAMDDEDAEKMARMFGTFTEFKTTRQLELMAFGIKRTKGYSERDVDSFHNHPNEIKRLIAFKAAVKLAGGEDPKLITTPLIFEVLRLN